MRAFLGHDLKDALGGRTPFRIMPSGDVYDNTGMGHRCVGSINVKNGTFVARPRYQQRHPKRLDAFVKALNHLVATETKNKEKKDV